MDLGGNVDPVTRRRWFERTLSLGAGLAMTRRGLAPVVAGEPPRGEEPAGLIVRSRRPLDLETPVAELDRWLTPNDRFFVRSHFGSPAVGPRPWAIELNGLVDRPLRLDVEELERGEMVTLAAVLQCSGNGRAFFRPMVPGVGWERGAVGHAEWSGVRLVDLLRRAGLRPEALHVQFVGADGPPSPRTPAWHRSIPLERAHDPSTILATRMNGEPLPVLHGGPVRLVVPGWAGNHWMKWVRLITVAREESASFYMQTAYKMPVRPVPPDAVVPPSDMSPVTWLNVKSLITYPRAGAKLDAGPIEVRGVAWTGDGTVRSVEVSSGAGGPWSEAALIDPPRPGSWRRWKAVVQPNARGGMALRARASDTTGATQPESTPWNKSGYLWNAIDVVEVEVNA